MKSTSINIERAIPDDHLILTEITKKSKAHWNYSKEQMDKWNDVLTVSKAYISENETYKLTADNAVLGYYSFTAKGNNTVKLDNMFVLPDCIGKGYGKILMDDFLKRIGKTNAKKIILDSEPNAETFYQKFGFKAIGKLESSIKDRFLPIMELDLSQQ